DQSLTLPAHPLFAGGCKSCPGAGLCRVPKMTRLVTSLRTGSSANPAAVRCEETVVWHPHCVVAGRGREGGGPWICREANPAFRIGARNVLPWIAICRLNGPFERIAQFY